MTDKTLGAYTRHESPDYADGGVTAALIEQEAEEPTAEVRELRSVLAREVARGNALQDALDAAESHPLTPDAITDEMRKRARAAFFNEWNKVDSNTSNAIHAALTAALTEPPARPEWADLGEALDRLWPHGTDGIAREDIARRLHTEAGVRVVGEDGAA